LLVALDGSGTVLVLVCYELRGASLWLFGLRVREEAQGKGLASSVLVRSHA